MNGRSLFEFFSSPLKEVNSVEVTAADSCSPQPTLSGLSSSTDLKLTKENIFVAQSAAKKPRFEKTMKKSKSSDVKDSRVDNADKTSDKEHASMPASIPVAAPQSHELDGRVSVSADEPKLSPEEGHGEGSSIGPAAVKTADGIGGVMSPPSIFPESDEHESLKPQHEELSEEPEVEPKEGKHVEDDHVSSPPTNSSLSASMPKRVRKPSLKMKLSGEDIDVDSFMSDKTQMLPEENHMLPGLTKTPAEQEAVSSSNGSSADCESGQVNLKPLVSVPLKPKGRAKKTALQKEKEHGKVKETVKVRETSTAPSKKRPRLYLSKNATTAETAAVADKQLKKKDGTPAPDSKSKEKTQCTTEADSAAGGDAVAVPDNNSGVAAIINLGNTCFLNSVLQVLRYTPGFVTRVRNLSAEIKCTTAELEAKQRATGSQEKSMKVWRLVNTLSNVYERMERAERNWENGTGNFLSVRPYDLLECIEQLNATFEGGQQQDAHELMRCLMDLMQNAVASLNNFRKPHVPQPASTCVLHHKRGVDHRRLVEIRQSELAPSNKGDEVSSTELSAIKLEAAIYNNTSTKDCINGNALRISCDTKPDMPVEMDISEVKVKIKNDMDPEPGVQLLVSTVQQTDMKFKDPTSNGTSSSLPSGTAKTFARKSLGIRRNHKVSSPNIAHHFKSGAMVNGGGDAHTITKNASKGTSNLMLKTNVVPKVKLEDEVPRCEACNRTFMSKPALKRHTRDPLHFEAVKRASATLSASVSSKKSLHSNLSNGNASNIAMPSANSSTQSSANSSLSNVSNGNVSSNEMRPTKSSTHSTAELSNVSSTPNVSAINASTASCISAEASITDSSDSNFISMEQSTAVDSLTADALVTHPSVHLSLSTSESFAQDGSNTDAGHPTTPAPLDTSLSDSRRNDDTSIAPSHCVGNEHSCSYLSQSEALTMASAWNTTCRKTGGIRDRPQVVADTQSPQTGAPGVVVTQGVDQGLVMNSPLDPPSASNRISEDTLVSMCAMEVLPRLRQPLSGPFIRTTHPVDDHIEQTFQGQMAVRLRCCECETQSQKNEIFQDMSVAVSKPKPTHCSDDDGDDLSDDDEGQSVDDEGAWLREALESIEWLRGSEKYRCDGCFHLVEARRSSHIVRAGHVLAVHLLRFSSQDGNYGTLTKVSTHLPTPLSLPCVREGCGSDCGDHSHRYELYAVVMHMGVSLSSGHYVAYVRVTTQSQSPVRVASQSELPNCDALVAEGQSEKPHCYVKESSQSEEQNIGVNAMADPNNNQDANNNVEAMEVGESSTTAGSISPVLPLEDMDSKLKEMAINILQKKDKAEEAKNDSYDWLMFDDDHVTRLTDAEFVELLSPAGGATPYLLFYKQCVSEMG